MPSLQSSSWLALIGILLLLLLTVNTVEALAVFDNTVRCEPHPTLGTEEGLNVCVGSFEYYYIPDWMGDTNTGYSWIYTFVDDGNNNEGVGERVFVKTDLDYTACTIGLGYPSTSGGNLCQSCSPCGLADGGPDERTNGLFKGDCTNLPGGRLIDNCESTFPFFFPVDFYDEEYLNQGSTTMVPETAAPSSGDSYEASGMGTSSKSSDDSKDSSSDDSTDVRTFDSSSDDIKPRSGGFPPANGNAGENCVEMIQNGGFETGSFGTEWMTETDANSYCEIGLNDGSTAPFPNVPIVFTSAQPPIAGNWDVFTQQQNPGMCRMKQIVSGLPENIVSATLSWKDRIFSYAKFADPGTEARVRVCMCEHHDHDDEGMDDLHEVWSTDPGDTTIQQGPNARSYDVTSLVQGKSSVDIIFEQQEDFNFFNMYWDEISLVVCTESDDPSATAPTTTSNYRYQSEFTITMDVSPDTITMLDAEIVLEKYKTFLQQQPSLGTGSIDEIDLVFQSFETNSVTRLDGATVGTVLIEFESKVAVQTPADSTMSPRQVATSMANDVNWSDFIVNYLRNAEGGAFKRTGKVHLKLIGGGGGGGDNGGLARRGRLRKLSSSSSPSFEVNAEGSSPL